MDWSKIEIDLLVEKYSICDDVEILEMFPNRTLTSIKVKAKRLKIYRTKEIKRKNRSNGTSGIKNGMYGKKNNISGKTYEEYYGFEKSNDIKIKLSNIKKNSDSYKGEKNGMYGKIPYNKGISSNDIVKKNIKKGIINYWNNLTIDELEYRKNQLRKDWLKKKEKYSEIDTIPEKITESILLKLNIEYIKKKNIGYYNCDFVIDKKIIEVQGDYWHGNSNKYIMFDEIQQKNIKRDERKLKYLNNNKYDVLYLWEYDLKNHINICENKIKEFIYGQT